MDQADSNRAHSASAFARISAWRTSSGKGRKLRSVEAIITFLLVLVIVSVATDDRVPPAAAGLAVGFALFAAVAIGSRVTGGSVNPARAFGPMLVAGSFPMWAMYLLAPVVGGVVAALLYDRLLAKADAPEA